MPKWSDELLAPMLAEAAMMAVKEEAAAAVRAVVSDAGFADRAGRIIDQAAEDWARDNLTPRPEPQFSSVGDFVNRYVAVMWPVCPERAWSPQWWTHADAYRRLSLMWLSYEAHVAASGGLGEEQWLRTIGDYHARHLFDRASGPFYRIRGGRMAPPPAPLPTDQPDAAPPQNPTTPRS